MRFNNDNDNNDDDNNNNNNNLEKTFSYPLSSDIPSFSSVHYPKKLCKHFILFHWMFWLSLHHLTPGKLYPLISAGPSLFIIQCTDRSLKQRYKNCLPKSFTGQNVQAHSSKLLH